LPKFCEILFPENCFRKTSSALYLAFSRTFHFGKLCASHRGASARGERCISDFENRFGLGTIDTPRRKKSNQNRRPIKGMHYKNIFILIVFILLIGSMLYAAVFNQQPLLIFSIVGLVIMLFILSVLVYANTVRYGISLWKMSSQEQEQEFKRQRKNPGVYVVLLLISIGLLYGSISDFWRLPDRIFGGFLMIFTIYAFYRNSRGNP